MRPPSGLDEALRQETDKQAWVDWLFSHVAPRYDLGNDVMSVGMHRVWKRRLIELATIGPEHRVLDVACGTGDVTFLAAARAREVVGTDINADMLALAEARRPPHLSNARFERADAAALPYPDASFDRVLVSYAGRGFPDWPAVLRECYRVLVPGGEIWNLDFARPPVAAVDKAYRGWLTASGAVLGTVLHGDPLTYVYIPASMRHYRGQRWLEQEMVRAGFTASTLETRLALMAYNQGKKPR